MIPNKDTISVAFLRLFQRLEAQEVDCWSKDDHFRRLFFNRQPPYPCLQRSKKSDPNNPAADDCENFSGSRGFYKDRKRSKLSKKSKKGCEKRSLLPKTIEKRSFLPSFLEFQNISLLSPTPAKSDLNNTAV